MKQSKQTQKQPGLSLTDLCQQMCRQCDIQLQAAKNMSKLIDVYIAQWEIASYGTDRGVDPKLSKTLTNSQRN
jgi:hypothetical protein